MGIRSRLPGSPTASPSSTCTPRACSPGLWEDAPTRAEIERVLDEFEETAWAGLDRDRYIWSAVLHRDHDGGVHVHIFTARCDLATGRSLNVAAPGWQKIFDPLRDAFNYEHGWSRPDDPARARPYRPSPHLAYLDAETLRAGWEVEPDRRALIGEHLLGRVTDGAVKDRAGVVAALEGLGFEVPRQGRHYVTILRPETGERLRLKGGLYEADFDRERFMRQREPSGDRERAARGDNAKQRAADAWRDLEEKRLKRAEYHRSRYGGGGRARAGGARDAEREAVPESLAGHLRRELGDEAVVAAGDSVAERHQELEAIRGAAAGDATAYLAVVARVSVADDRDRAGADSGLARVVGAVRAGAEAAGRADRGLAAASRTARGCGDALDRAVRDVGPDIAELMLRRQVQRALAVSGREQAVGAMSKGAEWFNEVQQEFLSGADRRATVAGRERIVETVEGRIEADFARRKAAVGATSSGSVLLRKEEDGAGGAADSQLQSFAEREAVLARIEDRVEEELEAQEEALRSIPFGKQYVSEAEQARAGGAEEPPSLAERESMVHTATGRVEEEFDRREKRLAGVAGNENLLVEVAGGLDMAGGTLTLGETWRVIEAAERRVEQERAKLEGREAALLEDPAGAVFLSDARREILGDADREANTLEDRGRVIQAAEVALQKRALAAAELEREHQAALRTAMAATQAAAGRSGVELHDGHVRAIYATGATHASGLTAVERTTAALAAAADQQLPTETVVETWNANMSAPGEIAVALEATTAEAREQERQAVLAAAMAATQAAAGRSGVELHDGHVRAIYATGATHASGLTAVERTTAALAAAADQQLPAEKIIDTWRVNESEPGKIAATLHRALAAKKRVLRLEQVLSEPAKAEAFIAAFSRPRQSSPDIDRVLDLVADRRPGRRGEEAPWHALVLEAELKFPGVSSTTWRKVGDAFTEPADTDRHASSVSRKLSARALARALAAEEPERSPPAGNLEQQRVIEWLRTEVERQQLKAARLAQRNLNSVRPVVEKAPPVPKPARRLVPDATWEDAEREQEERRQTEAAQRRRQKRLSRLEQALSDPAEAEAFVAVLDAQKPAWRTGATPADIDQALDAAEGSLGGRVLSEPAKAEAFIAAFSRPRQSSPDIDWVLDLVADRRPGRRGEEVPWHALVLEAELKFPGVSSTTWRKVGDAFTEPADTDRHASSVSRKLSARALARALAAEEPEPPPAGNLEQQRVIEWLRTEVERQQLKAARLAQRNLNSVRPVVEKAPPVPKPARRLVPDATWEDAEREQEERRQTEAAQRRRQKRLSRLEQALSDPAEAEAFVAVLDAQKPAWRTGATPADIDQALDAAEGSLGGRKPPSRRYQLVLEMERMIPGAPSTACRAAAGRFDRTTEVGREGLSISQTLSDRALARAFAAEKPEPPAPRHLVERLFDWLRTQLEKLFRSSGPAAPAGAEDLPRLTFEERYSQQWPEHAADIHRPDFEELAAARNKLFERQELYSSKWSTVDPQELPISLAKPARAWTDEAVQKITWAATPGVGYSERRTLHRQIVDAHLDDYERKLPEQYAYSADWRTILQRAEEAVRQLQDRWRYKWADRRKDDRKKRELEAATINRACGRDARRLHKEMMAARAAARPDWEATVRIRAVQGATRDERIKLEDAARKENLDQRGLTEPTPQLRASHDRAHRGRR